MCYRHIVYKVGNHSITKKHQLILLRQLKSNVKFVSTKRSCISKIVSRQIQILNLAATHAYTEMKYSRNYT